MEFNKKLYIFIDGNQVVNTYKGISAEIRKARNELANMTIGSDQYVKHTQKIASLNQILEKHKIAQGQIASRWERMGDEVKSFFTGNILSSWAENAITTFANVINNIQKSVTDFQATMTDTFTNLSDADIEQYGEQMSEASKATIKQGYAIEDVNKAMFDYVSAGGQAADTTEFLAQAERLSTGGSAQMADSVNGLTNTLNSFNLEATEAANVADAFYTAQKFGKTTVSELANNMGKAAPNAAALNVQYQELLSSVSALTLKGISTSESFSYMKALFSELNKPSKEAEKNFKALGIPVGTLQVRAAGFNETLRKINEAMAKNPELVSKSIGSVEALTAVNALSGEGFQTYSDILKQVNEDTGEGSSLNKAYEMQQNTLKKTMARLNGEIKVMMIEIGEKFLPYISKAIAFTSGLTKSLMALFNWISNNIDAIKTVAKFMLLTVTAIFSYNAAVKVSIILAQRQILLSKAKLILDKLENFWFLTRMASIALYNAAVKLMTFRLREAATSMKIFFASVNANGFGLMITLITTAVGALIAFKDETKETAEVAQKLSVSMNDELYAAKSLFDQLKKTNQGSERRNALIKEINDKYGTHLQNLKDEKQFVEQIDKAYNDVILTIKKKIILQTMEESLISLYKEYNFISELVSNEQKKLDELQSQRWDSALQDKAINMKKKSIDDLNKTLQTNLNKQDELIKKTSLQVESLNIKENNNKELDTFADPEALKERAKRYKELFTEYSNLQKKILEIQKTMYSGNYSDFEKQLMGIEDKFSEQINVVRGSIQELNKIKNPTKEDLELLKKFHEQELTLNQLYMAELAHAYKDNDKKVKKERDDFRKEYKAALMTEQESEVNAVKEKYNKLIEGAKQYGYDYKELMKKMNEEIAEINKKFDDKNKKDIFGMTDQDWDKLNKRVEDIFKQINSLYNVYQAYDEYKRSNETNEINRAEAANERQKQMLERRLQRGLISEANYNSQVEMLDKKLETKKRKIAYEQAVREKNMKMFEAIINTAVEVTKVLSNPFLAAAVAVAGGLQVAAIANTEIPKMAKGGRVKNPTLALIGEAGEEVVFSNRMLRSKEYGPAINYMADVQAGLAPSVPRFSQLERASSPAQQVTNTTVNNTIDSAELVAIRKEIVKMTDEVRKLKFIKAIMDDKQFSDFQQDKKIIKMLASF